jgi:hypothetical protein
VDILEIENEIIALDKIKLQKLVSWLTHKDLAVAVLLFSKLAGNLILESTSKGGRQIIAEEKEEYKDSYEEYVPGLLVKVKKYISLIIAGKSIENIADE